MAASGPGCAKTPLSIQNRRPRERFVSRQVVEELGGGFVAEASQSGAIVVIDEGMDEGVALSVVGEAVFAGVGGVAGVAVKTHDLGRTRLFRGV